MARQVNRKNPATLGARYENLEFDFNTFMHTNNPYGAGVLNNPIWINSILKNIASSPQKYDRDKLRDYLKNPVFNEKALKDFAQYLYNTNMFFKRLVHYFADILDFRYILIPTNPDNSPQFKKAYNRSLDWLDKFDLVHEFRSIMHTVILEDVGFYYIRESDDCITLQRMPTDYCKIIGKTNLGYKYSINMSYFMQTGINIMDYPEEIQMAYWKYINGQSGLPFFYLDLDPTKAFVFKWDENFVGIMPVLLGIYLSALDIVEYQDLQRTRTQLDTWKMVLQKIPMRNDKDAKRNDFLIDELTAGAFHTNVKNALPMGASVITTPMDISAINFENTQTRENIVATGGQAFWDSAGVSPMLFGTPSKSSVGVQSGIKVDEAFVTMMYFQFARCVNFNMNLQNKKYKFKIDFLNGTTLNQVEQYDRAVQGLQYGMPVSLMGHAMGLKAGDLDRLNQLEKYVGIKERLEPVMTSHSSNLNEKGAPEKKAQDLSDEGLQTRDEQQNDEEIG